MRPEPSNTSNFSESSVEREDVFANPVFSNHFFLTQTEKVLQIMVVKPYNYVVSPDFDPTVIPEGYVWDETAFKELVKATDKATADQLIYTYGGAQGDADVVYENAGDLTISSKKYNDEGQVVDTTVTANTFDNTGTVTTDGAIAFSLQTFSNSGTFDLDKTGTLTATSAVMNMEDGTINLNAGSTLQGSTVVNGGTITVVSDHAAINGAISNHSLIDSVMKTLNVTGDIQNANEDDMREARNSSIIKVRNLNVTGNVTNYGVIGTEFQEANDITISGDLRNFHQIIVNKTLTADSVYQDYIDSEIEEKRCVGYIICGQVIAGEINNASGEISAGADKDAGIAIQATGKITNGKADALFTATLQAGDDGCIQAVDALNNIGAGSTVHAGYITVLKGTEAGDLTNDGIIQTKSITVDGSVTNSATGSIEIDGASTEPGKLSGTSIGNAGTLNLNGTVTLACDVVNSNLLNFQGTVTATGSITNAETGAINIKSAGSIAGSGAVTNSGTLHIAIQSGKENKITADNFSNTAGVGKITIGGSFAGGVASVITATEGDVKVSDITLSVTSADEKEVTAATRGGNVVIASGVDYNTIYLSNAIDEAALGTVVQDSTGASYYVDFNAFKFPASALEDGVRAATTTILIDGATASALKYESETLAAIDGLAFAKDGTNGAAPEEEKNVEFVLTGMDPADPESYRDLKKGITVGAGVTLTVDKLYQTGKDAVTNINGELRAGTYNTGIADDPATADVDESVGTGTVRIAAGLVNVNDGGALYECTVLSGGTATIFEGGYVEDVAAENGGRLYVGEGGTAKGVTVDVGGTAEVSSGVIDGAVVNAGGGLLVYGGAKLTGRMTFEKGAEVIPFVGSILDFDLTQTTAGADVLVNDLSILMGTPSYTLTVDGTPAEGDYKLAGGAAGFSKTITVTTTGGEDLGTLTVGQTATIGGVDYTLNLGGDNVLSVTVSAYVPPTPTEFVTKSDIDGNGISDVLFVWTGEHGEGNYQQGYWLNGTNTWQSANAAHPSDWIPLGAHDMNNNGKADSVMFGNVYTETSGKGAYIGYYLDADDASTPEHPTWQNIGYLNNEEDISWQNCVGNLNGEKNSIVWYAPDLYATGIWVGQDEYPEWIHLANTFGGPDWNLIGCGDFDGDGKDAVVMNYNNGQFLYTVDIDGVTKSLGTLQWTGWQLRAIGDFSGDSKDDIVLFHELTGSMVMCFDGNLDDYASIGQLAYDDWFVVGAGDYNGDQKDDLLVRQYSTGMLGYYVCADQNQWVEMGRGVGMEWTVIA